jgi:IS5 family transposase
MSDQMSLVEALLDPRLGSNEKLAKIEALIDWQRLAPLLAGVRGSQTGRPPYPPLSMLKAIYLQALYDLSDPGLEEALLVRLDFRRFCGLSLEDPTPDETTICRFRGALARAGTLERCLIEINRQLDARGLMLKKGTLMDASIVAATHAPPRPEAGMGAPHPKEPGADWTSKNGKSHFGYRLHVGVDEGSGLIRRAVFTSARTQDNEVAEQLISGDEAAVYADRIYESKARRALLKAQGIKDRIMHRRHKYMPVLPRWMAARNRLISKRRAPVESVFSAMKRIYGKGRTRCHSLTVNAADFFAFATVFNLRRASNVLVA